jgi:large subunit ribosomal protein L21
MYAIVEIAGKQFKVEKDKYIYTHRLSGDEGSAVTFDKVMLVDNSGKISVGLPNIKGATVTGKVLEHLKENGHRQYLSKVLIESINA